MRLMLLLLAVSGCGNETCKDTLSFKDMLTNAAPGGSVVLTTSGCSTCAHTFAQVLWSGPNAGTTGMVELNVQPTCFVKNTIVDRTATNGVGDFSYDWNTQNCGDQVDTYVKATNNSNVTFTSLQLNVDCTKFVASK
jgi:hypothetical protein